MDKRTRLLLILLSVAGLSYWIVSQVENKSEGGSMNQLSAERNFAVPNIEEVAKVFLADRKGNTTLLLKQKDKWLVNDRYKANPNTIENLLNTIQKIEIKYKPPKAAVNQMLTNLATEGIKVMVYDERDRLLKSYYVGGATGDELGTFIIMEGYEEPYVGHLPGWTGNIRFRFNLTGEDWRDKTVFEYPLGTIHKLSIDYPNQPQHSFSLEKRGRDYFLNRPTDKLVQKAVLVNQGLVERYLKAFEKMGAEAFENNNPRKDSIIEQIPFALINLESTIGKSQQVSLFPIQPAFIQVDAETGEPIPSANNIERYFAFNLPNDLYLIQHRVFQKILLGYDYFVAN
ncbi:MAG: DUF4340 domain-containing protein [Saprospiraceae bacterium]